MVNETGVAIVGSSDLDDNGIFFTEKLAGKCVIDNLTVVSGGARGVDYIAEKKALAEGGYVISVVPDFRYALQWIETSISMPSLIMLWWFPLRQIVEAPGPVPKRV